MSIKDLIDDRPLFSEACITCKHKDFDEASERVCAAFPDGIPLVILNGENNHKESFPGDHGIQWELISKEELARR